MKTFSELPEKTQSAKIRERLKAYCQRVYRKSKTTEEKDQKNADIDKVESSSVKQNSPAKKRISFTNIQNEWIFNIGRCKKLIMSLSKYEFVWIITVFFIVMSSIHNIYFVKTKINKLELEIITLRQQNEKIFKTMLAVLMI